MQVEVDVQLHGIPVQCAVEWEWENVDGLVMTGPADAPPTLRLSVTALSGLSPSTKPAET